MLTFVCSYTILDPVTDHFAASQESEKVQMRVQNYLEGKWIASFRITTDEADFNHSNDIMQHIAESCRNRREQHIGTDGHRLTSFGSTLANHNTPSDTGITQSQCDAIQAEINQLQEDVTMLRQADQERAALTTEEELAIDDWFSTSTKCKPNHVNASSYESAATRLQKLHETQYAVETDVSEDGLPRQPPPSPFDFPALAPANPAMSIPSTRTVEDLQRKASYADAATSGMSEAVPLAKHEEHSVIISSRNQTISSATPTSVRKNKPSPPNANKGTLKESPHFAQPTKSFARRTGETLRRDAASMSPKSPGDGSPGRTIKAKEPNLATAKRANEQQQKRKSLPGDWLSSVEAPSKKDAKVSPDDLPAVHTASNPSALPSKIAKAASPIKSSIPRLTVVASKQKQTEQSNQKSPLRKKTSSYMASTNATNQRTMAALSGNQPKLEHLQTKATDLHIDSKHMASPSRSYSPFSTDSSVHFILDSPGLQSPVHPRDRLAVDVDIIAQSRVHVAYPPLPASPPAAKLRANTRRSPTRGPRARNPENGAKQMQQASAWPKDQSTLTSLPIVANTTTKRRTSHGNVLTPIVARLESEGILNKGPQKNGVIQAYLQHNNRALSDALHTARESSPGSSNQARPSILSEIRPSTTYVLKSKVVPPHLRPRSRLTSTSTTSEDVLHSEKTAQLASEPFISNYTPFSPVPVKDISNADLAHTEHAPMTTRRTSAMPSLRATAKEFTPVQQPDQAPSLTPRRWTLDRVPEEDWQMLPWEAKLQIYKARDWTKSQQWLSNTLQGQHSPGNVIMAHEEHLPIDNLTGQRALLGGSTSFVDEYGSPNAIHFGHQLRPGITASNKNAKWLLQDSSGEDTPIKFGRAPAPDASAWLEPSTPTISSGSGDTSPLKTPYSTNSWHIGSSTSRAPYGWKGGDGKEISFMGYGPHAERYPNSVVNFNFQGCTSRYGSATPNGFEEEKENIPTEFVAPRSQRQWAEKLGYHKMPCGNVEITHAVEHLPFGSQLANYCHDCMAR